MPSNNKDIETPTSASTPTTPTKSSSFSSYWIPKSTSSTSNNELNNKTITLTSDPVYKKYSQSVDRSLASFLDVQEWADFIAFLAKLLKAFQTFSQYKEIPHKLIVAKRLSQCLNPALPTGVHQKALEMYDKVFTIIGIDGLKADLQMWSSGLFPFFQYAATSVRQSVLDIYKTHYFPLQHHLRPVMKAFTLAILPGLEEETGEYFDEVLEMLDYLNGVLSPQFFLQNIWLILITSPSSRIPALNYLCKRISNINHNNFIDDLIGDDPSLMIRGISCALTDDQILVRRSALDLLIYNLKIDGEIIQKYSKQPDTKHLVRSACNVVLRKEISLSRRLYTWLLGSNEGNNPQEKHFCIYGLPLLKNWLLEDINNVQEFNSRPYKIFISLLDKWEVGHQLTKECVIDILRSLNRWLIKDPDNLDIKTITSMVLESIDVFTTWKELNDLIKVTFNTDQCLESISLVSMVIKNVSLKDEEHLRVHFPKQLVNLLVIIYHFVVDNHDINYDIIENVMGLNQELIKRIPTNIFHTSCTNISNDSVESYIRYSMNFYANEGNQSAIDNYLLQSCLYLLMSIMKSWPNLHSDSKALIKTANSLSDIVELMSIENDQWYIVLKPVFRDWFTKSLELIISSQVFEVINSLVKCISINNPTIMLYETDIQTLNDRTSHELILKALLPQLDDTNSRKHIQTVELIQEVENASPKQHISSLLASMLNDDVELVYERFGLIWKLTESNKDYNIDLTIPFLKIFNDLDSKITVDRRRSEAWLKKYFKDSTKVVINLLNNIMNLEDTLVINKSVGINEKEYDAFTYVRNFDQEIVLYSLKKLVNLSRLYKREFWSQLQGSVYEINDQFVLNYTLKLLKSEPSFQIHNWIGEGNKDMQVLSMELTAEILNYCDISYNDILNIQKGVIEYLYYHLNKGNMVVQISGIELLIETYKKSIEVDNSVNETVLLDDVTKLITLALKSPTEKCNLMYWLQLIQFLVENNTNAPVIKYSKVPITNCICGKLEELLNSNSYECNDYDTSNLLTTLNELIVICLDDTLSLALDKSQDNVLIDDIMLLVKSTINIYTRIYEAYTQNDKLVNLSKSYLSILFDKRPAELVELFIENWSNNSNSEKNLVDIINVFSDSSRVVTHIICRNIGFKTFASSEKSKLTWLNPNVDENLLFKCLENYIDNLDSSDCLYAWSAIQPFSRDVIMYMSSRKSFIYPTLRCIFKIGMKVFTSTLLIEKKVQLDYQDLLYRFTESCILLSSGSLDTGTWALKKALAGLDVTGATDLDNGVKSMFDRSLGISELSNSGKQDELTTDINSFIAFEILPNLSTLITSLDKLQGICSNVAYYLIGPNMKAKNRMITTDNTVITLLENLTYVPHSSKSWKSIVGDAFFDMRFFNMPQKAYRQWKILIHSLMTVDKERFIDLINKVSSVPSTNIFANREYESLTRALNLRRLSFAIFAGEKNSYMAQLPIVQEKLVEVVRNNTITPTAQSEVYLCLRVLLCRVRSENLTTFWPIVLTELLRLFETVNVKDDTITSNSENLPLLLSACKFLDTLLVLQNEDFQVYQSLFITDTIDAKSKNKGGVIDKLGEIYKNNDDENTSFINQRNSEKRQPLLINMKNINRIQDLSQFFNNLSNITFNNILHKPLIDYDMVEQMIEQDFFDNSSND